MSVIYPAPRWFREAVAEWLDETPHERHRYRIGDLFTRIVNAQPHLRMVEGVAAALPEGMTERERARLRRADAVKVAATKSYPKGPRRRREAS
jgi:hypothetical protein